MTTQNLLNNGLFGVTGTGKFVGNISPEINQINDTVYNLPVISFTGASSAVNYLTFFNSATGNAPGFFATGTDSNINMQIQAKGTGSIFLYDGNSHPIFEAAGITSAVNFVEVTNNSTGQYPTINAVGADTNIYLELNGKGNLGVAIQGNTAGGNALTGYVGEVFSNVISSGSAVSFTNNTAKDLTILSLPAGDFDVYGNIIFSGTTVTAGVVWISLISATAPDASLVNYIVPLATSQSLGMSAPFFRVSVSTTTTVYLSGVVNGTGSLTACGGIYARRAR